MSVLRMLFGRDTDDDPEPIDIEVTERDRSKGNRSECIRFEGESGR